MTMTLTPSAHRAAAEEALADQEGYAPGDPAHLSLAVSAAAHLMAVLASDELAARPGPETKNIPPWHTGPDWSGWHTVAEAARLAAEPAGVRDVVLVTRADLRDLLTDSGIFMRLPDDTYLGRLARAAFADPAGNQDGLSAYSCQACGHIAQPEYWHDTSEHTSTPEGQCEHPQDEIDDDGVCGACDEAVEGPALDAVVLDEIARLLAGPEFPPPVELFAEIRSLARWTGRNGGPEPGAHRTLRAGIYDAPAAAVPFGPELDASTLNDIAALLRGGAGEGLSDEDLRHAVTDLVGLSGRITDNCGPDDEPELGLPDTLREMRGDS